MSWRHPRRVGPFFWLDERELVGMVLALIETGVVVAYPNVLGHGPDEWGVSVDADEALVRPLPGDAERGRDRRGFPRPGGPTMIADRLPGLGWVEFDEHDRNGIRRAHLTETGEQWLTFCRGNHTVLDVSRFFAARATALAVNERARRARGEDVPDGRG